RVEVDVVGPGAPDRDHLEIAARRHDTVGEPGMGADVDGHLGSVDAPDQLGLVVGAARNEYPGLADLLAALVGGRAVEDGREVIRDGDCSGGLEVGAHRGWPAHSTSANVA